MFVALVKLLLLALFSFVVIWLALLYTVALAWLFLFQTALLCLALLSSSRVSFSLCMFWLALLLYLFIQAALFC